MADDIIKPKLLKDIAELIDQRIWRAVVTISGQSVDFPIYNTILTDTSVRKYIYLTETEAVGKTITGAALVNEDGQILASQPLSVTKGDKGYLISFEFNVKAEVSTGV